MNGGDTIAAIATAQGRGGVAVVRVSGPEAQTIAVALTGKPVEAGRVFLRSIRSTGIDKTDSPMPINTCRCQLTPAFALIDEAVVLFFKAPHSYTGEDVVEFQCHGGAVTPRRVLEACFAAGARLARRGEFTQRAFLNGKLDYDQAESVLDLIDAKTARAANAALEGLSGGKRRALQSLYESALDLSTQLEHALDIDEGELPDGFLQEIASSVTRLTTDIGSVLRRINEGKILRNGALVVLAGPPNAGKSSLMNALLEENRAIVSDRPGTTRDSIEETLDLDGWPIRLVDTAGIRTSSDAIETEGVRRAEDLLSKADIVLWLDGEVGHSSLSPLVPHPSSLISIHSKCDLARGSGLNVSAKTGEGLEKLKRTVVAKLVEKSEACDFSETVFDTSPLQACVSSLSSYARHLSSQDLVLAADAVRSVAERLGTMVGAIYSDDLLNNLFSRFCVGK